MRHSLSLVAFLAAAAACGPPAPPAPPGPHIPGGPTPQQPPPDAQPLAVAPIQLRPSALRYAIHRRLHIEQQLAGQPPTLMSYRVFVTAAITGPADSTGYAVTHSVDSIVPDSGSFVPPTVNFAAASGLRFSGRLTPVGAVQYVSPSDSTTAQLFSQFLGNLRDFYPRLPASGLVPAAAWTDTTTTAERATGGEVQLHSVHQSTVTGWEQRGGVPCLRIQVRGTFTLQGVGEQGGQPFELSGSGTRSAVEFVTADGRYFGGETRDSMNLSVSLPAQGMTVPIRQVLQAVVTVVP